MNFKSPSRFYYTPCILQWLVPLENNLLKVDICSDRGVQVEVLGQEDSNL